MDTCEVLAEAAHAGIWALCKSSAHGPNRCELELSLDCSGASFKHCAYLLRMDACGQYQLRGNFVLDGSTSGLTSFWCGMPAVAVDTVPAGMSGVLGK